MSDDSFTRTCEGCQREIEVQTVSEYHCGSRMCGYSFTATCSCGAKIAVDGCDGEGIPDTLKRDARIRWEAFQTKHKIDKDRRDLKFSAAKATLKESRLRIPEAIKESLWTVYRFDDGRTISYSTQSGEYSVDGHETTEVFQTIDALADYLEAC